MWPRIGGIARLKEGTATDLEEYVMERVGGTTTVMGQGDATILILVIRTTGNENIAGQALPYIHFSEPWESWVCIDCTQVGISQWYFMQKLWQW